MSGRFVEAVLENEEGRVITSGDLHGHPPLRTDGKHRTRTCINASGRASFETLKLGDMLLQDKVKLLQLPHMTHVRLRIQPVDEALQIEENFCRSKEFKVIAKCVPC